MEKVYLESSFISYLSSQPSKEPLVAIRQRISGEWWDQKRKKFLCCISQTVLDEISQGDPLEASKRIKIVETLPLLSASREVDDFADLLVNGGILPHTASQDAVHIAFAVAHEVDYLLTWNCKHLANAHIIRRIYRECIKRGVNFSTICTPEELLGENDD